MPDEEIDKLISDAAGQHHPPYDDKAWGQMELLLDKHMPQKNDRKKPIFFLLGFLLLAGVVFFTFEKYGKTRVIPITKSADDNKPVNTVVPNSTTVNNTISNGLITDPQVIQQINLTSAAGIKNSVEKNVQPTASNSNNIYYQKGFTSLKIKRPSGSFGDDLQDYENASVKNTDYDKLLQTPDVIKPNDLAKDKIQDTTIQEDVQNKKTDTIAIANPEIEKITINKKSTAVVKAKKNTKKFADKFAITFSGAADVSYIEINNAGKLKPAYGVGLNYTIGKRFTISSGLYIGKKIYSATPYQYKFSSGYPNPNLIKINADCNVYEIPVAVYYDFKQIKNHNWFSSIGLSSFLMKKESYDYLYKTATGQTWNYVKTISNENKHYLSVITLSGGYKYKLNNRFSLIAAPYLKIPLSGIGLGKIKLNSTGLLFTIAIKPFTKRGQ
ncbi:MAG: hypothetical protein RIS73_1555 [Bacteroidota bacterium]